MPTAKKLLGDKLQRLETVPDQFFKDLERSQKTLFSDLVALINQFEVKEGLVTLSDGNVSLINDIGDQFLTEMYNQQSDYTEGLIKYTSEYKNQQILTNEWFEKQFRDVNKSIFDKIVLQTQEDVLSKLNANAIESELVAPLKNIMNTAVSGEQNFRSLVDELRLFMEGNEEKLGRLRSYASTFVTDAFNQSDRRYTELVSNDLGLKWFRYSGGKVADTREFCLKRNNKTFHINEIKSWGKISQWQGRNSNTNPDNIFQLLGGYNCLHSLIPVPVESVSKPDIDRARTKGFIK